MQHVQSEESMNLTAPPTCDVIMKGPPLSTQRHGPHIRHTEARCLSLCFEHALGEPLCDGLPWPRVLRNEPHRILVRKHCAQCEGKRLGLT